MWNAIQINGKWYALDVTWDDTDGKQKNSKEQYQYFLKGEKTFLADVSHRVVNCMFIQDKVPITEYACLTAPILEKGDYGTQTSVKKSTANTKITVRSGVKYKITHTKKKTAAMFEKAIPVSIEVINGSFNPAILCIQSAVIRLRSCLPGVLVREEFAIIE